VNRVNAIAGFWWDFVVGDDWRTALGVVLSIALTAVLAAAGIAAWWFLPAAVLIILYLSIRRASRMPG
jgi:hypothetical protein